MQSLTFSFKNKVFYVRLKRQVIINMNAPVFKCVDHFNIDPLSNMTLGFSALNTSLSWVRLDWTTSKAD